MSEALQQALVHLVTCHRGYGDLALAFPFSVEYLSEGVYGQTNGERIILSSSSQILPMRQLLWLIGHELAHILLGHTRDIPCADPSRLAVAKEIEADQNVPKSFDPVSKARHELAQTLETQNINTLERIYEWLGKNPREVQSVDQLIPGGDPEMIRTRVLAALAGAGELPGNLRRAIDGLREPSVPWAHALAQHIGSRLGRAEYAHGRLVPHYWAMGLPVPPVDHRRSMDLVVAVDSSGSMAGGPIRLCLSQLRGLRGLVSDLPVYICDAVIQDIVRLEEVTDEEIVRLTRHVKGYGGTDFRPVFEALEAEPPQVLVYLTDADGTYPTRTAIDTLWVTTSDLEPPFGRVLRIPVFEIKEGE